MFEIAVLRNLQFGLILFLKMVLLEKNVETIRLIFVDQYPWFDNYANLITRKSPLAS